MLHFDAGSIDALQERGVNTASVILHVGAGTFQPVRTGNLAEHTMHREWFEVGSATVDATASTRAAGGRVVAISQRYRFFSYGDAMLLAGKAGPSASNDALFHLSSCCRSALGTRH